MEAIPYLLSRAIDFKLKVPKMENLTRTKDGKQSEISFSSLPTRKIRQKRKVVVPATLFPFHYLSQEDKIAFPFEPEQYELIRSDVLASKAKSNEPTKFYELELHLAKNKEGDDQYRVFFHTGILENASEGEKQCYYTDDVDLAEAIYSKLFNSRVEMDYESLKLLKNDIGSELAQRGGLQAIGAANSSQDLSEQVDKLVQYIFHEAASFLKNSPLQAVLSPEGSIKTPLGTLSLPQVEKAESVLLRLYKIFQV